MRIGGLSGRDCEHSGIEAHGDVVSSLGFIAYLEYLFRNRRQAETPSAGIEAHLGLK